MTHEKRQEFVAELRRLGPLFEKSGISDCFIEAADELERLSNDVKFWKTKAEQSLDMLTAYQLSKANHR